MSKGNIVLYSIFSGLVLIFMSVMLFQEMTYPKSALQDMRPMAVGKFIVYRDCYNVPSYYIDANPVANRMAIKMDNRSELVELWDLKENSEYRIYMRQGILIKDYYFVECIGEQDGTN